VVGEKGGFAVLALVNAQCVMHIVFQLYDILRFGSTVVINQYIIPKSETTIFFKFRSRVHKYASRLTLTPRVELFCRCKRKKICRSK